MLQPQLLQPAPHPPQNHDAIDRAGSLAQRLAVPHHKHIGPGFMLDRSDAIQPCQGGFHVARSTPFAQHTCYFNAGRLSIVFEHARRWIDPDVA